MKNSLAVIVLALGVLGGLPCAGQDASPAQPPVPALPSGVADIVKLARAKLGDAVLLAKIKQEGIGGQLTAAQIVYLHEQGVSPPVISALLQSGPAAGVASPPAAEPPPLDAGGPPPAAEPTGTATDRDILADAELRASYALGLQVGHNFKAKQLDMDPEWVGRAIQDAFTGSAEQLTQAQVANVFQAFRAKTQNQPVPDTDQGAAVIPDEKSRLSYAIGLSIGHDFVRQQLALNAAVIVRAIRDALTGGPELLTPEQVRTEVSSLQVAARAKQNQRRIETGDQNRAAGAAFLNENRNLPGIRTRTVTLADGREHEFQYQELTRGFGASPGPTDTVKVNYRGTFIDGIEFDSSYKRGQPASFQLDQVISGWSQALQLMKPGAKWKLFLPPDLAYGDQGNVQIPPGSTLIFEVELLEVSATPAPMASELIKVPSAEEMRHGAKIEVIRPPSD